MNVLDFIKMKQDSKKISMVTCYDYWSAQLINDTDIDVILVGDSLAMVMHGHSTTLPVSVDIMALHTESVAKGAPKKFIVGDLPFLSYRKSLDENMNAIEKLMKAGANSVKLEGAEGNLDLIKHIVDSGVPVMGHLGLTPQSIHQLGGFTVQGKEDGALELITEQALALQKAGCFAVVFECIPQNIAEKVTQELSIPTIGIGAGKNTDGQVLVLQDLLGMNKNFKPKFLRHYMNGYEQLTNALNHFNSDVKTGEFPNEKESYS